MKSILAIDDDLVVSTYIKRILQANQYRVMTRKSGKSGLEIARQVQPDLILCDVLMPDMSGYEVLEALKQDSATSDIPFIFLTSKTGKRDIIDGIELGAAQYLSKPIASEDLLATVATRFLDIERECNQKHHIATTKEFITISPDLERDYSGWWLAFEPNSHQTFLGKTQKLAYIFAQRAHPCGVFLYHRLGGNSSYVQA
ncbi:PleD family two-component system response regulator [Synechococcus sp. PCC 7336]|uniref:response regulator n=1 Tax=Synechococcus sp. PCC 7336 TaxID=195250 RepID=UPI000349E671|nr:response regulator [Synechococcus sp. PCC 7336]